MRKLILICIGVMCMFSLHAQDKVQADSAYAAEKYEEAIPIYTALLKEGEHADIYYNLGNCYYKTDRLALAILNYERAALLDPGSSFFVTWYKNIIDMMSMDGWARTGIVAFVLACVLILVFFLGNKVVWKKLGFFGALVMLAVVVMVNVFAWTQHQELNARSGAVVMSSSVVVKSTPNESGTDLFVLHEGTRVEIIDDSMKEWKEIRLADGKVGWMPTEAMEVI